MSTPTKYVYAVVTDFPNGEVSTSKLLTQIRDSSITTAVDRIDTGGGNCDIWFKDALQATDKTTLDGDSAPPATGSLVGDHDGVSEPTADKVELSSPSEPDGKPVFVMSPATEGWMTWFAGADDDANPTPPASGRGTGQQLRLDWVSEAGVKSVDFQCIEPVELHDGQLMYTPADWTPDSRWDFAAVMPATVTTPNGTTTGNCNLVDMGGYNLIVPAAGDGTHDIDLAQAVPVPASDAGYWDVDPSTGVVTVSATSGSAKWHLFDIELTSYFMRNMPMGNPLGVFNIDTYKAEWVSERWKLRLTVDRQDSAATTTVAGWLMLFREKSI